MRTAALSSASGQAIPLRAASWHGRVMIECHEPDAFLEAVCCSKNVKVDCPPGSWLRGVVIPGEGGFFDLFDGFGTRVREVCHLSPPEAKNRILDLLIWEVKL